MQVKTKAIVLSETPYSETSKILNILTEDYGLIGVISRGSRNIKSKLRGISNKMNYCEYTISYKEKTLSTLIEGNIINSFKSTGISINLDGSEQHLVHKHAELCDEIIIPNDVILEPNEIDIAENIGNNLNLIKKENNKEGNSKITDYFSISNGASMDIE